VSTVSLTVTPLPGGGEQDPGPRVRPYVQWDGRRQVLWVTGGEPQGTSRALRFWRMDPAAGAWSERTVVDPDALSPGSQSGTFSLDRPTWLVYDVDPALPWPGEALVATLSATRAGIGLRVRDARGEVVARSLDSGDATVQVAFGGLPGERYTVELVPGPGFGPADSARYVLRVAPAVLTEEGTYTGWRPSTLLVSAGVALLAGKRGVEVVDLSDPAAPALLGRRRLTGKGQALAPCGPGVVCLASTHTARPLRTLDPFGPGGPVELGHAFGLASGRGLAVGEGKAYVAAGLFGVEVFDVTDPSDPCWVDRLALGGLVLDVAWRHGVLYAAMGSGEVVALRVTSGASPETLGRIQTQAHAVYLRLEGDALLVGEIQGTRAWARCLAGITCAQWDGAEAFDVSPEAWGIRRGSWQGEGLDWLDAATVGDRVVFRSHRGLAVYRAEVQP